VQSNNFTTLFVLSRKREVEDSVLDVSFPRAKETLMRCALSRDADFYLRRLGLRGLACLALTWMT
jgi:hypothetical protein